MTFSTNRRDVAKRFRTQYGLATRSQLRALNVSDRVLRHKVDTGEWELASRRVIRVAAAPRSREQALLALCLEAGPSAVASHQSAAWLWDLLPAPGRQSVMVTRTTSARTLDALTSGSVEVHRPRLWPSDVIMKRQVPCTSASRTLVDLAGTAAAVQFERALDSALTRGLVTLSALEAEAFRLGNRRRQGMPALRRALGWRKSPLADQPSVLEAAALRLLDAAGIHPAATEVRLDGGRYRIDVLVRPGLVMEVDGFAFHSSPEQMAHDARRRNQLHLDGLKVLVYTWRDILYDGHRVVHEIRSAASQQPAAR